MWTLTARIPIDEEEQANITDPAYEGASEKPYIDIYSGLRTIALLHPGMLKLFEWVEPDVTATYIGILSKEEPSQELVEQLKTIHPMLGNVELDEEQVVFALYMAEVPE